MNTVTISEAFATLAWGLGLSTWETENGDLAVNTGPDTFVVIDQEAGEFWGTDQNYGHVFGSLVTPEGLYHLARAIINAATAPYLDTE